MSGDTANPRIWTGADVYTAPLESTPPTDIDTEWGEAWEVLGLLSEDGVTESRDEDETDHHAYGGILVRTTRSKHKRTFTVAALEDTPVVRDLRDPGSTSETTGDITTTDVTVPTGSNARMFGFEFTDGDIVKRIVIERGDARASGDRAHKDDEMDQTEFTVTVYPVDGVLYVEITNDPQAIAEGS